MANPRQEAQESSRKVAEEANRAANKMADAGERTVRAGAAAAQRNAEAAEEALESGSEAATEWTKRSTEQVARAFGFGGEEAEKALEQSTRNLRAIAQSSTILANGMQELSREWLELLRKSAGRNLAWVNAAAQSRSPQEFAAAQSEMARDNLQDLLQATRRSAEASARMADEATRKMTEAMEAAKRT
jgi:phasin family protein